MEEHGRQRIGGMALGGKFLPDRLVGGGILTKAGPSKASPRSNFMVDYPYVWKLAERHRLGSVTPHHFFAELERAGSLERLVDKMKRLPGRPPTTTRELSSPKNSGWLADVAQAIEMT
ncbi:hypothetical protein [Mesorhizobium huakuii]|uniref:hypothetical protein n=1 Tax=Mesorhizobium huakuii TaxID=28104 RepID=UPI001FD23617|nr:hypothetical protein [Mesorhizobium huakuii]